MGTEVVQRAPVAEVCTTIAGDDFKAKIAQAVPVGMAVERFTRTTLTAIQQNPEVVTADRQSLYNAVIRAAQDGLLPDGREAALVIFKGRDGKKVQYLPMIGGLRKRAAEHGFAIDAFVVHENDDFYYALGFEPVVHHVPPKLGEERGKVIGAYAVATRLTDGRKFLEPPMSVTDIEKVRQASRAKDNGPWVTWWDEMARKTVARRLFKSLPLVPDEQLASTLDAADSEFEFPNGRRMSVAEANAAAGIGQLRPPRDTEQPDDGAQPEPPADVIDAEPVDETEAPSPAPEEEPEAVPAVSQADTPPAEPASSSGEAQRSIFEEKAEKAQKARRARDHRDPAA